MASGIASELEKRELESVQFVQGLMSREAVLYSTVQWPLEGTQQRLGGGVCGSGGADGGGHHVEHVSLGLVSDVSMSLCLSHVCLFFCCLAVP